MGIHTTNSEDSAIVSILFSLERFPEALRFDRYINYPHGGEPIWTPLFDGVLALLAFPVYVGADPASAARVETVLMWVPPILGAATVVVVYWMARRIFDPTTALVSGVILALLSGHYWYSQVGFIDHHAAVALLSASLLAVATRGISALGDRRLWGWAVATGLVLALLVLVWPGALLHVLILEAALLGFFATRQSQDEARRAASASVVVNAVAALTVALLGRFIFLMD